MQLNWSAILAQRPRRKRTRGAGANPRIPRRGFTLIEVLAATTVVTIGLLGTFYMLGVGTSVNTDARNMAQAYQAAQQEVEVLRNIPYTTLKSIVLNSTAKGTPEARFLKADGTFDASRPGDTNYPGLVPSLANLPNGRGGLILTNDSIDPNQGVKDVTVVIRWTDKGGVERSAIVGTMIAQGGMDPR